MNDGNKILVIDDDITLLKFLEDYLEGEGFEVVACDNGPLGLRTFYEERPDLVVLDVMMPGMDGWEVCARLRELADTPVMMLTAKTSEADKLRGFRLGVDDYITKPFSMAEVAARARAVLSRATPPDREREQVLKAGPLTIDLRKREARKADDRLDLTPTEYRLLTTLIRRAGEAVSQTDLIREVWGDYRQEGGSALRRYIWFLRQKIEREPDDPQLLVTVRGYGYRLEL
jgi:two-component system KDP operon response regulator KdpE